MRLFSADIVVVLTGLILGLVFLQGVFRAQTISGKIAGVIAGFALFVGGMWYYAEYGERPDDSLACWTFKDGKACRAKKGAPIPPVTQAPPPTKEVQIAPDKPKAPPSMKTSEPVYLSFDGWWPLGTPQPPPSVMESREALWTWLNRHKGSCQPLRIFMQLHPDAPQFAEAKAKLDQRVVVNEQRRKHIFTERPHDSGMIKGSSTNGQDAICEGLYNERLDPRISGSCNGVRAAKRLLYGPIRTISMSAEILPSSCKCGSKSILGNQECYVKTKFLCTFESNYKYDLEKC